MNELEKQVKETLDAVTEGLEPSYHVKYEIFRKWEQGKSIYARFIRIPLALSFFTTIIAVPISVY